MPPFKKILTLYLVSTFLSGIVPALILVLPSAIGRLTQGHILILIFLAFVTFQLLIYNLVFFICLNKKFFEKASVKGSLLLFYLPSAFLLLYILREKNKGFTGDSGAILLCVLVNILCITIGAYLIFRKKPLKTT